MESAHCVFILPLAVLDGGRGSVLISNREDDMCTVLQNAMAKTEFIAEF